MQNNGENFQQETIQTLSFKKPPRGMKKRLLFNRKAFLIIVLTFMAGFILYQGNAYLIPEKSSILHQIQSFNLQKDQYNILLLGVDKCFGINRSDTIMFCHFDLLKPSVKIMSIPRDTRVFCKRYNRYFKINHAFALGSLKKTVVSGPELAREVSEDLFGLPIDYHLLVNLQAFEKIVDVSGGVTLEVDQDMKYDDNVGNLHIDLKKGIQHLNGNQAMQFVRFREKKFADIGRIKRQQMFIKAMMHKLKEPVFYTTIPALVRTVFNYVETDMTLAQILAIANKMKGINRENFQIRTIPGTPKYIKRVSYFIADQKKMEPVLMEMGKEIFTEEAMIPDSEEQEKSADNITVEVMSPVIEKKLTQESDIQLIVHEKINNSLTPINKLSDEVNILTSEKKTSDGN